MFWRNVNAQNGWLDFIRKSTKQKSCSNISADYGVDTSETYRNH